MMTELQEGQELESYQVVAFNYASDSENRIHSDEVAAQYGFRGGLVPGVGVYAYMTVPVVRALGRDWLEHGDMAAKFIKPVYEGETVTVKARVAAVDPVRIIATAENEKGELCGLGEASFSETAPSTDLTIYTLAPPPAPENRLSPDLDTLKENGKLGALTFIWDPVAVNEPFRESVRDTEPIYAQDDSLWHPALLPHLANQILVENVALGPWIHAASDVDHFALPEPGERIVVRGRISHAYAKRGHEIAVVDIVFSGLHDRILALMTHTAIVSPRKDADAAQTA